ncbi:MAG: PAS domain-containing protein [Acidobacteriia bacterium]|nr:PAS domain-containing protein [Terriglobia bacterium]
MQIRSLSRRGWLLVALFTLDILASAGAGWWYCRQQREQMPVGLVEVGLAFVLIAALNTVAATLFWRSRQLQIHRERTEWLQGIADNTPAYLWTATLSGEASFINRPLAQFLGTSEKHLGFDWVAYIHPEDGQRVRAGYLECAGARKDFRANFRIRRFDGEYRWVLSQARPSFSITGELVSYVGALIDWTEQKQAEEAAAENAELLRTQNRVMEQIAHGAPLAQSLDLLLRSIETLAPPVLTSILLVDDDGAHMRHAAAPTLPEGYIQGIDGLLVGSHGGSCGTAAFRGERVVVEDIESDPLWESYRDLALKHGLRACWSTPVLDEQRQVLGTFALYLKNPGLPTKRHLKLIKNATYIARIAIVRHRETEALRLSEERLRLAVKGGNVGVWEWVRKTGWIRWSDEMKAMMGRADADACELPFEAFLQTIDEVDRRTTEAALRLALETRGDYRQEFRVLSPDNSVRWIAAFGRGEYGGNANVGRMLGVAIDLTDRKRAEEEIQRRDVQLMSAQRLARLGSYEWDRPTGRVDLSEELCRIYGVSAAEIPPTLEGHLERVHPQDRESTRAILENAFSEQKPFDFEARIIRPDGEVRMLHSQGQWAHDAAGRLVKLLGICQDITERKRAERQLLEANTALQALSSRLIHAQEDERTRIARELHDDLSQQIAAVSIATSNLKRGIPEECAELRVQSERIQQKAVHLADAVRRLSHELHPAALQHGGLAAALKRYCSDLTELTGIRIVFRSESSDDGVPEPVALSIYRVAQEALQNVVKHAKVDDASILLERSGGVLRLTVSDFGVGTANDSHGRAGLGLTSMKERARLVNGSIHIQSTPGKGTTVTLTIPDQWVPVEGSVV